METLKRMSIEFSEFIRNKIHASELSIKDMSYERLINYINTNTISQNNWKTYIFRLLKNNNNIILLLILPDMIHQLSIIDETHIESESKIVDGYNDCSTLKFVNMQRIKLLQKFSQLTGNALNYIDTNLYLDLDKVCRNNYIGSDDYINNILEELDYLYDIEPYYITELIIFNMKKVLNKAITCVLNYKYPYDLVFGNKTIGYFREVIRSLPIIFETENDIISERILMY